MSPRLLTVPQVAHELGVKSANTVYRLIAAGHLQTVDIGIGRPRVRVPVSSVDAFIRARTTPGARRSSPSPVLRRVPGGAAARAG